MSTYLSQNNISRYQLSKESGIPWATLADIYSGKTKLERCSGATLLKLANTLHISVEELLGMDEVVSYDKQTGLPKDRSYLEANLTPSLKKAINDYTEGMRTNSSVIDCLWGELYGTINAHQHAGVISKEQADYLRAKYLFDGEEYVD